MKLSVPRLCALCASVAILCSPCAAEPADKAAAPDAKPSAAEAQAPPANPAPSPETTPAAPATAKEAVLAALKAAQAQPGWHARYTASIHKSGSDPFDQEGAGVRQGELFYREGRPPKAKEFSVKLYRFRGRVAVYDAAHETWLSDKQAGDATLGKGLEDPDVAMDFLHGAIGDATDATPMKPDPDNPGRMKPEFAQVGGVPCRLYTLRLSKQALGKKVNEQYQAAAEVKWEDVDVSATLWVGGEPALPRKFVIDGVLPTRDKVGEDVKVHILVEVTDYADRPALVVPPEAREILEEK